jgi:hypothetical protein
LVQSGRTLLNVRIKPVKTGWWWLRSKVNNIQYGVNYSEHAHTFPEWFKRYLTEEKIQNESSINKSSPNLTSSKILPVCHSPLNKMNDLSNSKITNSLLMTPTNDKSKLMNRTEIDREIIEELQFEEDKYENESQNEPMSLMKNDSINRFNRNTNLNNPSLPINTLNGDKDEYNQDKYDKVFGNMANNESENILNDYEEEIKEQMMENSWALDSIRMADLSPDMVKNASKHFMIKKSSIGHLAMNDSIGDSPRVNYFTNGGNQLESGEYNENSLVGSFLKKSGEFDGSLNMLIKGDNKMKDSTASIAKILSEE